MMSVGEARTLIPDHEQYSDEQIEEIVRTLDGLANLAFDCWLKERNKGKGDDT